MEPSRITDVIHDGAAAAERVLLRVEELELLIAADRPRRLIEMAQTELSDAISEASGLWDAQDPRLPEMAASSEEPDVRAAWRDFKDLLVASAERSAQASELIAGRLAVAEDVMSALGNHREYGRDAAVRGGSVIPFARKALLA